MVVAYRRMLCFSVFQITLILSVPSSSIANDRPELVNIDALRGPDIYFALEEMHFSGADWVVGMLASYREEHAVEARKKGFQGRIVRVTQSGIAIHLKTGKVAIARMPLGVPAQRALIATVDAMGGGAVYLGIGKADYDTNAGFGWKWVPEERSLQKLGSHLPLAELSNALSTTHWELQWPKVSTADWDGNVQIFAREGKQTASVKLLNSLQFAKQLRGAIPAALSWNGGADGNWDRNQRVHAGATPNSFISLVTYPLNDDETVAWSTSFHQDGAAWRLRWGDLRSQVEGTLTAVSFIHRVTGPCREGYLACEILGDKYSIISFDAKSGALTPRLNLSTRPRSCLASDDGKLLVTVADTRITEETCTIYKMPSGEKVVSRSMQDIAMSCNPIKEAFAETESIPFISAACIDPQGAIIFAGDTRVYKLAKPYSGELVEVIDVNRRAK